MKLRVATYNVHNTDGAKSILGIAEEIKDIGADFVGLGFRPWAVRSFASFKPAFSACSYSWAASCVIIIASRCKKNFNVYHSSIF